MANTLGTLASAIILQEALELLHVTHPILKEIATDFSSKGAALNQTVTSRIIGVPNVVDFVGGAASPTADIDVPVTMTAFKKCEYNFTATELNQAAGGNRNIIQERALPMAQAMGDHFVSVVLTHLAQAAVYTNATTQALAGVGYSTATKMRKNLVNRGVNGARYLILNGDAYEKFANDSIIISQSNNGGQSTISDGVIRGVSGFTVFEGPTLPTTANLIGFAGRKDACILTARVPVNPEDVFGGRVKYHGNLGTVTATSGFSCLVQEWIGDDLSANVRMAFIYGVATGNPLCGERLITA